MKEKHGSDIIYALADYKQLVLAYKTKHAELVKAAALWRASVVWLGAMTIIISVGAGLLFLQMGKAADENRLQNHALQDRLVAVSARLEAVEEDLKNTRDELSKKEAMVQLLEKNISTTSKKLVEKLLSEQEAHAPAP